MPLAQFKKVSQFLYIVARQLSAMTLQNVQQARQIFARQHAEEEVRRLNLELEQRVNERTVALAAANQELESFAYSVSHDLRSPLRSLDGFSQALLEDYQNNLPSQAQGYLNRIRASSRRMGELIDDLLHLSRITRVEMKREEVNISEIVWGIAFELQQMQPERKITWIIPPRLVAVADPSLMRIALYNLVDNAWKFTSHQEHATIEIG